MSKALLWEGGHTIWRFWAKPAPHNSELQTWTEATFKKNSAWCQFNFLIYITYVHINVSTFFSFPDLSSVLPHQHTRARARTLSLSFSSSKSSTILHVQTLNWLIAACWNLFCPHAFECWIDESDRVQVRPPRRPLRCRRRPERGALGPWRDLARRVHSQHRRKPWRKPPIGSGHNIHTVLFPITAALLSRDRNSQRVWDVQAPETEHDLRKSQGRDFGGWVILSNLTRSFWYVFICRSHIFIPYPSFIFFFISSAQSHICVGERLAHFSPKGQRQYLHYPLWI